MISEFIIITLGLGRGIWMQTWRQTLDVFPWIQLGGVGGTVCHG